MIDLLVKMQQHAQDRNKLLLVLLVTLLEELQQYVLQVHVVNVSWRSTGFWRRRRDS